MARQNRERDEIRRARPTDSRRRHYDDSAALFLSHSVTT